MPYQNMPERANSPATTTAVTTTISLRSCGNWRRRNGLFRLSGSDRMDRAYGRSAS